MPGGNRKGPMGQGPMTGRRMGVCGGVNASDYANPKGQGLGMGRGGGRGRGWCHRYMYHATGQTGWQRAWTGTGTGITPFLSRKQELTALKQQVEELEQTLSALRLRIQHLVKPDPDTSAITEE